MMTASSSPTGAAGTVSAVIVTCDRPALLERTIESVLRQTHPVDEIIVSDDGHRAATAELLRTRFPRVRHMPGPSKGLAANRNSGIRQAIGEWILLNRFRRMLGALQRKRAPKGHEDRWSW